MADKRTNTKIALTIGKIIADLKELHDKVPEENELVLKLTKDISALMYQYSICAKDWDDNTLMVDAIYKSIIGKF